MEAPLAASEIEKRTQTRTHRETWRHRDSKIEMVVCVFPHVVTRGGYKSLRATVWPRRSEKLPLALLQRAQHAKGSWRILFRNVSTRWLPTSTLKSHTLGVLVVQVIQRKRVDFCVDQLPSLPLFCSACRPLGGTSSTEDIVQVERHVWSHADTEWQKNASRVVQLEGTVLLDTYGPKHTSPRHNRVRPHAKFPCHLGNVNSKLVRGKHRFRSTLLVGQDVFFAVLEAWLALTGSLIHAPVHLRWLRLRPLDCKSIIGPPKSLPPSSGQGNLFHTDPTPLVQFGRATAI